MAGSLPPHIQSMLLPEAYPHPVDGVELRQTHISYLLFAGDFVYKVKKPLDLGFLNFTTLEQRQHFCQEEVRLNRRLCDRTYLGVVPISFDEGAARVDAGGEPFDYAVKMRRLPDEGMMTPLLERDGVSLEQVAGLARRIAGFHAATERSAEIDRLGGLETVTLNWRENFEQTESVIGRTIDRRQFGEIRAFVEKALGLDADLFDLRVREGRVRDGHGDLRADAVCFEDDGVCIFDCIEFNERFRYSDVAADIAFLAMDLEERGRQDLSDELMSHYLGATLDATLPLLLPFYKCYRAYVRGKVDGFQLDQPEVAEAQQAQAAESARRYFALAHAYASQPAPRVLIITAGVTGSGKSRLANALAARLGFAEGSRGRAGLVLAAAMGTMVPAFAILPANVPNMALFGAAESIYLIQLTYGDYMALNFPVLGVGAIIAYPALIGLLFADRPGPPEKVTPPARWSGAEKRLALLLGLALALWVSDTLHGISPAWVALGAGLLCVLPGAGLLAPNSIAREIDYGPVLFLAGIIGLGAVATHGGLGSLIGAWLLAALEVSPGRDAANFAAIVGIGMVVGALTTIPAQPAIMAPMAQAMAEATGWPLISSLMVPVTAWMFFPFPYQTPPLVIAVALGGLRIAWVIRMLLAFILLGALVLLPLHYLWGRWLGYFTAAA